MPSLPPVSGRSRRRYGSFAGAFLGSAGQHAVIQLNLYVIPWGATTCSVAQRPARFRMAALGSDDADPDRADPGEGAFHPIAAIERELPGERAAHDVIAGPQPLAEFGELAGQPDARVERVAQHGIAAAGRGLGAVDRHKRLDLAQLRQRVRTDRRAEHKGLLLGVV